MHKPASGALRTPAIRKLAAAICIIFYICLAAGQVNSRVYGQPGVRAREKVATRPRVKRSQSRKKVFVKRNPIISVSLWVVSNPPRCKVFVNGEEKGETDADGELEVKLWPGIYRILLTRAGHIPIERDVEVTNTLAEQEVDFTLQTALTALNVVTDPPESEVYLDNVYKGASNSSGLLVVERVNSSQPHTLRVTKDGYQQQSVPVTTFSGQISVKLLPDSIKLKVTTEPPEAEVYLDDVYKGASTASGLLLIEQVNPNQSHTLRAKRSGYLQQSTLIPPNSSEASIKLLPDPVVLLVRDVKHHVAQGRLVDAFKTYDQLALDAPANPELPQLLESIIQSVQSRSMHLLKRTGPYGLSLDLKEVQEMSQLYEQSHRWRAEDETIDNFARYWELKYILAQAEKATSASDRESLKQKARSELSDFSEHNLRNINQLFDIGWAWGKLDNSLMAQKYFNKAKELKPDWAYPYFALGSLAMNAAQSETAKSARAMKYNQAIDTFTRAIDLKRDFARAYALRSIVYGLLKKYEESVANGLQAVTLDPQSAYAHFALGSAYFLKGKSGYRKALAEYNSALSVGGAELDDATQSTIRQRLSVIGRALK